MPFLEREHATQPSTFDETMRCRNDTGSIFQKNLSNSTTNEFNFWWKLGDARRASRKRIKYTLGRSQRMHVGSKPQKGSNCQGWWSLYDGLGKCFYCWIKDKGYRVSSVLSSRNDALWSRWRSKINWKMGMERIWRLRVTLGRWLGFRSFNFFTIN